MWHLLPVDLPQSIAIHLSSNHYESDNGLTSSVRRMTAGWDTVNRVLGDVYISKGYPGQHHEPAATVDFRAISKMLRECEEQHDHHNWNHARYQSPASIQLIDVEDLMIISSTTQCRYLALSYVWGEQDSFAATIKSRESLTQKGGLEKHMKEIPQTIKDAMEVVRNLGERYLWVDRLCIEQDNATQKAVQIQNMGLIYSHALITVIAHAGMSATSPLPGVRPETRLGLPARRFGDVVMSIRPPNPWSSGTSHEKRGWTMQEQMLSQRCLYFDYHTTWFQCDKGVCREDRPRDFIRPYDSFNMHAIFSETKITKARTLDDFWELYFVVIERYRLRELKYAEDTVYAIQGFAEMLSDLLETPLISAVPLKILPCALQFYHIPRGPMPARIRSAPSWSWAGWRDSKFGDYRGANDPFRISAETVELEMKFECKSHALTKVPIQSDFRTSDTQAADATERSIVRSSPYTLLDIQCYSTKASAFRIKPGRHYPLNWPESKKLQFQVHDQVGTACGCSFGIPPSLSDNDYHSDNLKWIMVSRSKPTDVSLQWVPLP